MINQIVENLDLTGKEAMVYLAALELGRSPVSEIARKAQLNRITTYEILKRLAVRGLANGVTYQKATEFQVVNPELFLSKRERQLSLARQFLPQLLALSNQGKTRPKVNYYQGVEGIRSIYEDTLTSKEKIIYNIANPKNLLSTIGEDFFNEYVSRRVKKKIKVMVLIPDTLANHAYAQGGESALRETRFFNPNWTIPNEIMIYGHKIVLLSFSNQIGVVIQDKEIAESVKTLWKVFWKSAQENTL